VTLAQLALPLAENGGARLRFRIEVEQKPTRDSLLQNDCAHQNEVSSSSSKRGVLIYRSSGVGCRRDPRSGAPARPNPIFAMAREPKKPLRRSSLLSITLRLS
jgi:hypothetical protein